MKLIVTDMDGTLLNSNREISEENAAALLKAQQKGIEIAIATGRTYGNALALCRQSGLNPHIISNHGAFIYNKKGERLLSVGIAKEYVQEAVSWLASHDYFYSISTDIHSFIPANTKELFTNDYNSAKNRIAMMNEVQLQQLITFNMTTPGKVILEQIDELFTQDLLFGSIASITFDQDKLTTGRKYFSAYPYLSMTIAGRNIFEMIHPSVSKGEALVELVRHLGISLDEVMAIGDNYNDLSMLEKAGISVAIGNAEPEVKKACRYVSLSNDLNGVAYIINQIFEGKLKAPKDCG